MTKRTLLRPVAAVAASLAILLGATGCVADPAPLLESAVAGEGFVKLSWSAPPGDNASDLVGYVVMSYYDGVPQPAQRFESTATTQLIRVVPGASYTFRVKGVNSLGNETASSLMSQPITASGAAVSAGQTHSCAIISNGQAKCWGDNSRGQLGNGTTTSSLVPTLVRNTTGVMAVTASSLFSCDIRTASGGILQCWGAGDQGQRGNSPTDSSSPAAVIAPSGMVQVDSGDAHSCALLASGAVRCWGANLVGQLGGGYTDASGVNVPVTGIADAVAVSAGGSHSCAVLTDGTVRCWGTNAHGELGNGTTTGSSSPVTVSGIVDATDVAAGQDHTCARLATGSVACWGSSTSGQLGDGTTTDSSTPVTVAGLAEADGVAAGQAHSCARLASGSVACWGSNVTGQLGNGASADSSTPVTVVGISTATYIDTSWDHTCAALPGWVRKCWGANSHGQLGDGTTANSNIPVDVANL